MDQPLEERRTNADECRKLAASARTKLEKDQFLALAEQWELLARERQRTMNTKAKLRDI